ncbi:hypothetical protein [Stutzerimonas balearica]|uniref:hypothetical protein n=1 Tax=Stutzerimonas balearica TaxID=74829 RepID=UPI0028ACF51D|nr:hypothetical protein [Stutzerimonas balearica]
MSYQGPADVTISAEYFGRDPVRIENPAMPIRLQGAGGGLSVLHFEGNLNGPADATHVTVTMPNGLTLRGEIKQGEQSEAGGWLSFSFDSADLGL